MYLMLCYVMCVSGPTPATATVRTCHRIAPETRDGPPTLTQYMFSVPIAILRLAPRPDGLSLFLLLYLFSNRLTTHPEYALERLHEYLDL